MIASTVRVVWLSNGKVRATIVFLIVLEVMISVVITHFTFFILMAPVLRMIIL